MSRGARQRGWTSCLTSVGRVTLAGGTTFLHIILGSPIKTGTTLGVASVMKCLVQGIKREICIKEVKLPLQNPLRLNDRGKLKERGTSTYLIIHDQ